MYSIKKVSELLDIPTVTIRAWENRYHVVSPIRSNGGHRLYSDKEIETLKWLKEQTQEKGMKIGEAVHLLNQKGIAGQETSPTPVPIQGGHKDYQQLSDELFESLINLNTSQSNQLIDLAFSLFPFEDVFHHILTPVLHKIGYQWELGNVTVSQEHFSSQLILQRFNHYFRILPVKSHLPKFLAFCPEGESHQIGLMLFSLFIRAKGSEVIFLGPNTPLDSLLTIIDKQQIDVVAISITDPAHVEQIEEWVQSCKRKFSTTKIVLGGQGFKNTPLSLSDSVLSYDRKQWASWFNSIIH
ncbi:DNA-binding transcriptional MerR regulator [Salirhabdus euzebyi]|uniref:DNA-binding transcriptional MerR regulator n=1 Tax=Salirhabdus euzebyi TaxID=394506 RepID=A0A841Q619_9BACI|nr:MerR family transcriptional regulator [Salirhabdus euzebyi]MBB6453797.1 DNA-binding transcriptional MerR regulator [Salirhabdus euzebyi]